MQAQSLQYNNYYSSNTNDYDDNYFGNNENNFENNSSNEYDNNEIDQSNENEMVETNDPNDIQRIRVIVRKRPLSKKESNKDDIDIVELKSESTMVVKELK